MAIFQNWLSYLEKKNKNITEQEFIPEGGNPRFPDHGYSGTIPLLCWCLKL